MKVEIIPEQIANVYLLDGSDTMLQVRLLQAAGKRLLAQTSEKLTRATPLRVEWGPYVVLAEVWSCTVEGNLDLQVRHALHKQDITYFRNIWKP